jgi:hypothetical protein
MSRPTLHPRFDHLSLGAWYPKQTLVGVIDDPEQACRATIALMGAGFAEDDIRLLLGPEVVEISEDVDQHRSALGRMVYSLSSLWSTEAPAAEHYIHEAREGHNLVMVHAPEPDGRPEGEAALAVLREHGAHHLRYYGRGHMLDLS